MKALASGMHALTGLSHTVGRAVSPAVSVVPCGRFPWFVRRFLPPLQMQHAGGVGGETFLRRDLHPARSAKLRLAHERWASAAPGSRSEARAEAGRRRLQAMVRGLGGCAATHVEGTAEVLRLAEVFVTLALTSFLSAAQHFECLGNLLRP